MMPILKKLLSKEALELSGWADKVICRRGDCSRKNWDRFLLRSSICTYIHILYSDIRSDSEFRIRIRFSNISGSESGLSPRIPEHKKE